MTAFSVIPRHGMPPIDVREASRALARRPPDGLSGAYLGRRDGDGPAAHHGRGFARARRHAAGLSPVTLRNNLVK